MADTAGPAMLHSVEMCSTSDMHDVGNSTELSSAHYVAFDAPERESSVMLLGRPTHTHYRLVIPLNVLQVKMLLV